MSTQENASLETSSNRLEVLLSQPYQEVSRSMLEGLAKAGLGDLRASHLPILERLHPEGSRITELAEGLQIAKPSVVYLVNYLADRGYVERVADPRDGRAVLVRRTQRGWAADRVLRDVAESVTKRWIQRMGESEVEQLLASLKQLAEATRRVHAGAGRSRGSATGAKGFAEHGIALD